MINHCEWRSDFLILPHHDPPLVIPAIDDLYGHKKIPGSAIGRTEERPGIR
jgi:hypothetical protein